MITKLLITGVALATLANGVGIAYHYEPETLCAARMMRLGLTLSTFDYASADTATKRCVHKLNVAQAPQPIAQAPRPIAPRPTAQAAGVDDWVPAGPPAKDDWTPYKPPTKDDGWRDWKPAR